VSRRYHYRSNGVLTLECVACKRYLAPEDFRPVVRMEHGRGSYCRECAGAYNRRWKAANREAINARRRQVHQANPEPERARARARYYAHRPPLSPERVATCAVCGSEFRTRQSARKYCSDSCRWRQHERQRPAR
jgi:hypothetical protein